VVRADQLPLEKDWKMGKFGDFHGKIMGISREYYGKVFMGSFLVRFSWEDHGNIMGRFSWELFGIEWEYGKMLRIQW
jgi:hypothetical protein